MLDSINTRTSNVLQHPLVEMLASHHVLDCHIWQKEPGFTTLVIVTDAVQCGAPI